MHDKNNGWINPHSISCAEKGCTKLLDSEEELKQGYCNFCREYRQNNKLKKQELIKMNIKKKENKFMTIKVGDKFIVQSKGSLQVKE